MWTKKRYFGCLYFIQRLPLFDIFGAVILLAFQSQSQSWGFTSRSTARVILGQVLSIATCGTRTHRGVLAFQVWYYSNFFNKESNLSATVCEMNQKASFKTKQNLYNMRSSCATPGSLWYKILKSMHYLPASR